MTLQRPSSILVVLGVLAGVPVAGAQAPVRVGYLPATHDALLFIAKEEGLFDASQVDVQLRPYDNSVQILSDLKSGSLDIGIPGIATPAVEIGGRAPLSIVGGAASKSAALVASPAMYQIITAKSDTLDKLRTLRGRGVGAVRGSTGLAIFRQGLVKAGLDEKALDLREFAKPADVISEVVAGGIDAGLLWSPHMSLAEGRGLKVAIWMSDILKDHVCCRQIARDEFLQQARPTVEYLMGILRADQLLRRSHADAALRARLMKDIRRYLPTLADRQLARELFDDDAYTTVSPGIDRAGIDEYLKAMETAGLLRRDQCANVRDKVRPELMLEAYVRLGCKRDIARACLEKRAADCECLPTATR